jgi:hypothetical protein
MESRCWRARAKSFWYPQAGHAPGPVDIRMDAPHASRRYRRAARVASSIARGSSGGAATCAALFGPRRGRRKAGGQFRIGGPRHGAGAFRAGPGRLADRGHAQGGADDGRCDAAAWKRSARSRSPVPAAMGLALALRGRAGSADPVACTDTPEDDPPLASAALARSNALGWRAVLTAHEAAWDARWTASDILIDGDDESQRAVRFAVYHLTSAANPECDRVSIGARASPEIPISAMSFGYRNLPAPILYRGLARGGQGVADVPHPPGRARESSTFGFKGVLYAWESPTRAWRLLPSVCLFLTVRWWTF